MSQSSNDDKTPTPSSAKSVDDIFGELSKDDPQDTLDLGKPLEDKKDKKEAKLDDTKLEDEDEEESKEEDDEEIDELADIEEELEGIDEEKLELVTPVRRREILKVYPDLFKKFPYLEKAYYREQQFTEILPTIDDAKAAAESHQILQRYTEDMVEKGNVKNVLKMIKESNPETFAQVVDSYMDHLESVDPTAHLHVQSNLVKNIIIGMVEEAKSSHDDDLRTAALLLNKWAFGSSKFTPPSKMAKTVKAEDQSKEEEISKREQAFVERQLDSAVNDVNVRVNNSVKSAIENNIDPNNSMTDYVKRNASRDALDKISGLIQKDVRFQKIVDKLWEKSAQDNYSKDSQDEIRRAYLSKAKSLLTPVLKSARNEALRGMGRRVKEDVEEDKPETQREKIGKEHRLSSDSKKAKLDSLRGKTTLEALNALMGD